MFALKNIEDFEYFQITEFSAKGAKAFFTTRKGGVSKENYLSLNLGLHTEDDSKAVIKNRKIVADKLDFAYSSITCAEQVHSNNIEIITEKQKGKGNKNYKNSIKNTDGLLTDRQDVVLFSYYADCVPLYFYDYTNQVIGLAHSGWKGSLKKIGKEMLYYMVKEFDTSIKECLVGIGPAISREKYEVDKKIFNKIKSEFSFWKKVIDRKKNGHYLLDLPLLNKLMLLNNGVKSRNIIMSNMCTYRNNDLFYSYRRDKGKTGRMASIIKL